MAISRSYLASAAENTFVTHCAAVDWERSLQPISMAMAGLMNETCATQLNRPFAPQRRRRRASFMSVGSRSRNATYASTLFRYPAAARHARRRDPFPARERSFCVQLVVLKGVPTRKAAQVVCSRALHVCPSINIALSANPLRANACLVARLAARLAARLVAHRDHARRWPRWLLGAERLRPMHYASERRHHIETCRGKRSLGCSFLHERRCLLG